MKQAAVPAAMLAVVLAVFGWRSPHFLEVANLLNILVQASSLAIVATGMTFVLLTAGIDLSVGSIMFLSAAVAARMALAGLPWQACMVTVLVIGIIYALCNAFLIARLRLMPFVVTLATLYLGRGLGLYITETRAMNLPESLLKLGAARFLGIQFPVWILAATIAAAHIMLTYTAFGRHIYAVGHDRESARRAGIHTNRILFAVYLICGACAALGGLVAVSQLGAMSPTFGNQREFAAIAAAVLGGTSLFGGRGQVFPGTLIGAVLIQAVENGLVVVNADPYVFPLVAANIIFIAVLLDSIRHSTLRKLSRRTIRVECQTEGSI